MRIFQVKIENAFDYPIYYVAAEDVGRAASLALQADERTEYGAQQKVDRAKSIPNAAPWVTSVQEFCRVDQFVFPPTPAAADRAAA